MEYVTNNELNMILCSKSEPEYDPQCDWYSLSCANQESRAQPLITTSLTPPRLASARPHHTLPPSCPL